MTGFVKALRTFLILAPLCSLSIRSSLHLSAQDRVIVVEGGTLIDGTGAPPRTDSVILIEGDKIKTIGRKGEVPYPSGAQIIPAVGKFIVPALIDMHVHYRDWMPELFLAHGVTTICDLGNPTDWVLAQREGIAKGKIVGPRMFWVGNNLNAPRKEGDPLTPGERTGYQTIIESPEAARNVVREMAGRGVNGIKMYYRTTPELMQAVVEEAHASGLWVAVHLGRTSAKEAFEAGIDILLHSHGLALSLVKDPQVQADIRGGRLSYAEYLMAPQDFDPLIQLMVQKKVYFNPTLGGEWRFFHNRRQEFEVENHQLLKNTHLRYVPVEILIRTSHPPQAAPVDAQKRRAGYRNVQEFIRRYVKAGGKILAGSDSASVVVSGLGIHQEMQLLVDAGLTPMQALMAATKTPAEFLRIADRLGTIEAGKTADILVVNGDPLADIANTKKIEMVIQEGEILDTSYHPYFVNPIPRSSDEEVSNNQVPVIRTIAPKMTTEGSEAVTLTVSGFDFASTAAVAFNGIIVPTTFVSSRELRATVPAQLLKIVGTFPVTVVNPRPGGGTSNKVYFIVKFK